MFETIVNTTKSQSTSDIRNNSMVNLLQIVDLKEEIESDCFITAKVITEDYRKELQRMVENSEFDDNPIIRILHLKH